MKKDETTIIKVLILILTIINGLVYVANMAQVETKNMWGPCSIRYSDNPYEDQYQREKCLEERNQSIQKAEKLTVR